MAIHVKELCDKSPMLSHIDRTDNFESHRESDDDQEELRTLRLGRRHRRVTINEEHNCIFPDILRCQDECSETWLHAKDYERFRNSTDALVKTILFGETMSSKTNPNSFLNVLDRIYKSCCEMDHESSDPRDALTEEEEKQLLGLFQQTGGFLRVGLENRIAREIRRDMHRKRAHLLTLLENTHPKHDTHDDDRGGEGVNKTTCLADEVHRSSLSLSRPARLFSQHLARAQLEAS